MNNNDFTAIVDSRFEKCRKVLIIKAKEYATNSDRLHNFEEAAKLRNTTKSDACLAMGMKHIVSIIDIVRSLSAGNAIITNEVINEKFSDAINYLLLLEACITLEIRESVNNETHIN